VLENEGITDSTWKGETEASFWRECEGYTEMEAGGVLVEV
jgi:hypothetical protein